MKFKAIMGALAVLAASSFAAHADDAVSLRLNWYLGGLHVPFYYGKEKGFYKAEGIDLTINEGRGSVNTVQVVAAGSDTFGLADSSSVIAAAAKGAEVKSVMSVLNSTGYSVVSLASAGIKTPKDLEGKKFAVTPGDPLGQLFRAMAAYNKLDMSKISFVQVDPAAKVVSVLEKRVDGLLGGADDQFFLIKYKGETPAALRYADHGANIVGMTILTQEATIKNKADLVKRFVRATVKSWE
jgi:NitT/TauT family transport system substrate-binding protein